MADDRLPKQAGRRLEIHTVLDPGPDPKNIDPLLLVWMNGVEDISQPYSYQVKVWRLIDNEKQLPIAPGDLINTPVAIHVKIDEKEERGIVSPRFQQQLDDTEVKHGQSFVRRCGVFETFNDDGLLANESAVVSRRKFAVRQYSASIVPAFKMMKYETTFRVFQDLNVKDIIKKLTGDKSDPGSESFPNLEVDMSNINDNIFPIMQYCVQFRESTFDFLSRLMSEFEIWYYFDHNRSKEKNIATMILGTGTPLKNELQRVQASSALPIEIDKLKELTNKDLEQSVLTIKNFDRVYSPVPRRTRDGNFNILDPTNPITNSVDVQPERDLIEPVSSPTKPNRTPPDDDVRFRNEDFAQRADTNEQARSYAARWMGGIESKVASVTGDTRNPGFIPGYVFDRVTASFRGTGDDNNLFDQELKASADAGADVLVFQNPGAKAPPTQTLGTYILNHTEIGAFVSVYSQDSDDFRKVLAEILFPNNMSSADLIANFTNQGLANYLQNQLPLNFGQTASGPPFQFGAFFLGGGFAALTVVIPAVVQAIEKLFKDTKTEEFHCSFSAIPLDQIDYTGDGRPPIHAPIPSLPLPSGKKPIASGPHLAVVIGQHGTDTKDGDIFADSLGRIRVRFAWDRKKGEKPGDSFKRGDNTCWVRVSEGWAGRHFGTQFLPRIGQEVIVDFIDGDPDRPIVTGRMYNADHGDANLPFPQGQVAREPVNQNKVFVPTGFNDYRFVGLKTSSLPTPPAENRYHLMRLDETANCEQYLIRSQGRLDITAFAHSFWTTHGNQHIRVVEGKDKDNKSFGGAAFTTVGGEYDLHIGDSRYEGIEKQYQLSVKAKTLFDLQADHNTVVGGESTLNAKDVVIEAPLKITLSVGNSSVVVDPAGVWIQGPVVMLNSGGSPGTTADQDVTDAADAQAAEPGDQWNKRLTTCNPHPAGGGGGRRHHTAKAKHGLPVTYNGATQTFSVGAHGRVQVDGHNKGFADATISDLATIDQTQIGHDRLQNIDNSGHTVKIQQAAPGAGNDTSYANDAASKQGGTPGGLPGAGPGPGSDSTVSYTPGTTLGRTNRPADVGLFHELTHADHAGQGTRDRTPRADNFDNQEEANTIPDDNTYRDQRGPWPGMPAPPANHRTDHHDL